MNKWEVDEHKLFEKVRIIEVTTFVHSCYTKTETMKGSHKRNSFVEPVGMNGSNFSETLFLSFPAIITTRNGREAQTFIYRKLNGWQH